MPVRSKAGTHLPTDPEGRGVGRLQLGEAGLELAQLLHESVVLTVGDRRIVENVVVVVGLFDLMTEPIDALGGRVGVDLGVFSYHSRLPERAGPVACRLGLKDSNRCA